MNNTIAIISAIVALIFLFSKKIRTKPAWHPTVTPLASIIGSGFLVSAPLLVMATGKWAVLVMIGIVLAAYALGESLRFNIKYVEPQLEDSSASHWINRVEELSRLMLGIAYIISVAFYLKLLSAFALQGIGFNNLMYENSLTTMLLLFIGIVGKVKGLSMLELLETDSVSIKLAIIFSLIITYFFFNSELLIKGEWVLKAHSHLSSWDAFRNVLGTLIIIQGFETSRYLGYEYKANMRIKTMRYAQWISGVIYVVFIALAMVVFNDVAEINETIIIDISRVVAPVLPTILIIAAVMSQFSAAVADTVGSGGLIEEATHKKITVKNGYLLISLLAIVLTWLTNIYEIVSIASKAFAIYYALQICLTLIMLKQKKKIKRRSLLIIFYSVLLIAMCLVVTLGTPVE